MLDELTDAIALAVLDALESLLDDEIELSPDEKLALLLDVTLTPADDKLAARLLELFTLDELLLTAIALLSTLLDELVTEVDFLLLPPQAVSPTTTKITAYCASRFM